MEDNSSTEKGEMVEEPLLDVTETQNGGGLRTLPFILNMFLELCLVLAVVL
ncbi:hypothetical protein P3L10_032060 [Capsicum annuum]